MALLSQSQVDGTSNVRLLDMLETCCRNIGHCRNSREATEEELEEFEANRKILRDAIESRLSK